MLRQKEFGVLSGSEYFFGTIAMQKQALFYSVHMCGHYYCDKRYRIDRQGLDYLMLMLVENGTMELQFHEKTITAHSGDILLFDGNDYHAYHTPEYVEFYWVHFSGVNSLELYQHLTRENGGVLYAAPKHAKAAAQIRTLVRQFANHQLVNEAEHARLLYSALCYLAARPSAEYHELASDDPVQQAVSYIQLHLGEDLRLKQLAKQVHLSPSHLIRLFRARLHYSPHEFIICMRMDRAKYLLKSTDLPIKAIGAEVGYRTEASFTGAFTDKIGVSPRKFRELPLG